MVDVTNGLCMLCSFDLMKLSLKKLQHLQLDISNKFLFYTENDKDDRISPQILYTFWLNRALPFSTIRGSTGDYVRKNIINHFCSLYGWVVSIKILYRNLNEYIKIKIKSLLMTTDKLFVRFVWIPV